MKKSILSLSLVFMLILTGCEKDSVESVESSGSITGELGDKSAIINIGRGNRTINMNGCELGEMVQGEKTAGENTLEQYFNCLSATNFAIGGSNDQSRIEGLISPGLWSNNGVVTTYSKEEMKYQLESAINHPRIIDILREERMNITGITVSFINWPSSSNSVGDFSINIVLTPRPFIPIF